MQLQRICLPASKHGIREQHIASRRPSLSRPPIAALDWNWWDRITMVPCAVLSIMVAKALLLLLLLGAVALSVPPGTAMRQQTAAGWMKCALT